MLRKKQSVKPTIIFKDSTKISKYLDTLESLGMDGEKKKSIKLSICLPLGSEIAASHSLVDFQCLSLYSLKLWFSK